MIIQCEQCNTKFRLDDSKVTDKGVKVRCAKCRHVFTVRKDPLETETQPDLDAMLNQPPPDFGAMLDQSAAFTPEASPAPSVPTQESPASTAASESGFDYSDFVSSDFADQGVKPEIGGFEPPKDETLPGEVDFGGFDFDSGSGSADAEKAAVATPPAFDFDDSGMDQPASTAPVADAVDAGAFDFSDDVNFGEKAAAPFFEAAVEGFSFDPGRSGLVDSMGAKDTVGAESPLPAAESGIGESFNLDEFAFDDEPAAQPATQKPQMEPTLPVRPQGRLESAVGAEPLKKDPAEEAPQLAGEELPPLSIASRRKQSPLFGVLIAVATVVAVAVLGFFGYTMFLDDKGKTVTETGRITVRAVNASFVKNPVIGDLLVITGEAVNSFTKPRAAIQVKGMVYGANGQVLLSKNAYCGNPLTQVQLSTLSLDKIEAAMANQFGDSLANMEVAPGKAIPFVIVIAKPSADARDYGVEPAGSTVAAGKP